MNSTSVDLGLPNDKHCAFYPPALLEAHRDLITRIESRVLGFFLASLYQNGSSLGHSIMSDSNAADRVEAFHGSPLPSEANQTSVPDTAALK